MPAHTPASWSEGKRFTIKKGLLKGGL